MRQTELVETQMPWDSVEGVQVFMPTEEWIRGLQVGDLAPDCFGKLSPVTKIYALQPDRDGRYFVCYYTEFGERGSISNSQKVGRVNRTVALTHRFSSSEIDNMELRLRTRA